MSSRRERANYALYTYFGLAFGVTALTVLDLNPITYILCAAFVYFVHIALVLRK